MSIDDTIFGKRGDESLEDHAARVQATERVFRNVLSGLEGHRLIHLLMQARNPLRPRFIPGITPEQAAFRDGQADVIATLMSRGTNLAISKPERL
jgi:hypothetical protein